MKDTTVFDVALQAFSAALLQRPVGSSNLYSNSMQVKTMAVVLENRSIAPAGTPAPP
jgi:hypothetical protein